MDESILQGPVTIFTMNESILLGPVTQFTMNESILPGPVTQFTMNLYRSSHQGIDYFKEKGLK